MSRQNGIEQTHRLISVNRQRDNNRDPARHGLIAVDVTMLAREGFAWRALISAGAAPERESAAWRLMPAVFWRG